MADSCRPVSRHGRYHTANSGISDVQYSDNLQTYSTPSYGENEGYFNMSPSPVEDEPMERPRTSRGHRRARPKSRGGRIQEQHILNDDDDEESHGRPASRRGFTPETYERHDYDEFSHQGLEERHMTPEYRGSPRLSSSYSPEGKPPIGPRSPHRESPLHRRLHQDDGHLWSPRRMGHHERQAHSPYSQKMAAGVEHPMSPLAYESYPNKFSYEHGAVHIEPSPPPTEQADVLKIEDPWPSTPREKPPTPRPKSSKKRLKSGRRRSQESQQAQESAAIDTPILRPTSSLSKYRPLPAISGHSSKTTSNIRDTVDGSLRKTSNVSETGKDVEDLASKTQSMALGLGERTKTLYSIELHKEKDHSNEANESKSSNIGTTTTNVSESSKSDLNSARENRLQSRRGSQSNKYDFTPHDLPPEPNESESRLQLAIRLPDGRRHQHYFRPMDKLDLVLKFAENISSMDLTDQRLACNAPRAVFTDLSKTLLEAGIQDKTVLYLEEKD